MGFPTITLNPARRPGKLAGGNEANVSTQLLEKARADRTAVLKELTSQLNGLSQADLSRRPGAFLARWAAQPAPAPAHLQVISTFTCH